MLTIRDIRNLYIGYRVLDREALVRLARSLAARERSAGDETCRSTCLGLTCAGDGTQTLTGSIIRNNKAG